MSHPSATGNDQNAPLSDAAKAIARRLRPSDSIYRLAKRVFGIVLPETDTLNSKRVAVRFQDELQGVQSLAPETPETETWRAPEETPVAE